jgi:hypothetical protein
MHLLQIQWLAARRVGARGNLVFGFWSVSDMHDEVFDEVQREAEVCLQAESVMVMALLAMHPRPHQVMRRFRDLLDTWQNDPSEAALLERLKAPSGRIPSTVEQVIHLLQPPRSLIAASDGASSH